MGPVKDRVEQRPVHSREAKQAGAIFQRLRQRHQPMVVTATDAAGFGHQRCLGSCGVAAGQEQPGGGHRLAVVLGDLAYRFQRIRARRRRHDVQPGTQVFQAERTLEEALTNGSAFVEPAQPLQLLGQQALAHAVHVAPTLLQPGQRLRRAYRTASTAARIPASVAGPAAGCSAARCAHAGPGRAVPVPATTSLQRFASPAPPARYRCSEQPPAAPVGLRAGPPATQCGLVQQQLLPHAMRANRRWPAAPAVAASPRRELRSARRRAATARSRHEMPAPRSSAGRPRAPGAPRRTPGTPRPARVPSPDSWSAARAPPGTPSLAATGRTHASRLRRGPPWRRGASVPRHCANAQPAARTAR